MDPIASFLSKLSWGAIPPPSGWTDVDDTATPAEPAGAAAAIPASASGDLDAQLETARSRVAYLEKLLSEERARVYDLEGQVGLRDGRFDDA